MTKKDCLLTKICNFWVLMKVAAVSAENFAETMVRSIWFTLVED